MASNPPGACCSLGSLFEGEPTGKDITIGKNTAAYVATPPEGKAIEGQGILYLPDILGIWQNSKLMADLYAAKGYTTLIPDLFNGDQVELNKPDDFDIFDWLYKGRNGKGSHLPENVDKYVVEGIKALRDLGVKKIAAVGYCFGAKYVVRHYKSGIDVGFVAHPSFVEDDELKAITGPLSIAAAQTDTIFPAEKRHKSEVILVNTKQPWQITLFSNTEHGFAVRGDLNVKQEKFAKEQAFLQAVTWFGEHLN
jgi:dienelactone hydrolase